MLSANSNCPQFRECMRFTTSSKYFNCMLAIVKKIYEKGLKMFHRAIPRIPRNIVVSIIGRIMVLLGTDQRERVWNVSTEIGIVTIVQLSVGKILLSMN